MNAYFYSHAAPPPPSQATRTPRAAPPGSSGGSSGGGHLYNVTGTRPLSYPLSVAAATTQRTPAVTGAPSQGHGPPTRIGAHDVPASAAATPPAATPSSLSEARRPRAASSVSSPQSPPLPPRSAPTSSIPCLVLFTPQGPRPLEGLTTTTLSTAPGSVLESSDVAGRKAALRNRALGLQKDAVAGGTRGPAHAPEGVRCVYDRDTRSQLLHISPGTEADFSACVRLPGYARGTSTGLPAAAAVANTILAIQLCVAAPVRTPGERHRVGAVPEPSSPHLPLPGSVHVELVVRTGTSGAGGSTAVPTTVTNTTTITTSAGSASSSSAGSYRLRFTNAITEVQRHAHHTRFPLRCVRTAQWVQLYMDIDSIMQACQPSSASARSAQRVVVRLHQLRIGTAAGGFSGGLYVRRIVAGHGLPLPPYPLLDHFVHAAGQHSMSAAAMAEAAGAADVEEDAARGGWTLPEPLRLPVEAGETLSLFVRTGQEPVLRVPPSLPPPPPPPSTPPPDAASTEEYASTHDNAENEEQIARSSSQRRKQPQQQQQQQQRRHERVELSAKAIQRASSPLNSPHHRQERGESAGTKPRHHEPQTTPPMHATPPLRQRAKITATTSIAAAPERRPYTALELLRQRQEDLESQQQRALSRTSRRKLPLSSPPPQGAAYTPSAAQQSSSPPPRPSSQSTVEVFQVHEVPRASQLPWRTPPLRPPRGAAALNDAIVTPPMQQQAVCTPQDSPRPSEDGGRTASSATPPNSERWTVQKEEEEPEESDDDVALQNQRRHTPPASVLPAFVQHTYDVSQLSEADDTAWAVASADSLASAGSRHPFAPQAAAEAAEKTLSLSASVTSAAAEELLEEVRERVARLHAVLADKNTGAAWKALPPAPSRPASAAVASVAAGAAAPPLGTATTEEEKPGAVRPAETRPTPEPARARGSATPLSLMAAVVVGTERAAHKEVLPTNTNTSSPPASSSPPSAVPVRDAKAVLDLWSSSEVPLQLPAFAAQFTPQRKADKEKRFEKKEKEEERGDAAQPLREGTHPTERRAPGWLPVTSAAAEQPPPAITTAAAAAAVNDAPPQPDSTATSWTFHSTSVAATATTTTTTTAVVSGRGPAAAAAASALPRAGKTEYTKGDEDASGITSCVANARPASAATKAVVWRRPSAGAAHHNTEKNDNVRDNNDHSIAPMRQVSGKSESHGGGLALHRWKTPSTPPPLPPLSGAPLPPPPTQAEANGVGGDGKGQSTPLSAALVPAAVAETNASEHAAVRTPTGQPPPPSAQRCGANNTSGSTASSFHMWLPHPMPVLVAAQARYPFFTTPSSGGHSRTSQTTHSDTNATTAVRRVGQPPVVRLSAVNGGGGDGGAAAHSSAMPSMKDERRNEADAAVVGYALSPSPAAAAAGAGALLLPPPHPPVRGEDVSQRYVYDCVLRCFLDTETNAYVDQVA